MSAALLTLADSRLPAGGHTHSGGVEQAIAAEVVTDAAGTTVAGLYAAGECACVSVHGANRLGTNSLLDIVVFGRRGGASMAEFVRTAERPPLPEGVEAPVVEAIERLRSSTGGENVATIRDELQAEMTDKASVFRTEETLTVALGTIRGLRERYLDASIDDKGPTFNFDLTEGLELGFLLDLAEVLAASALARTESRGAHFRDDHPLRDDANWMRHSLARRTTDGAIALDYKPVEEGPYLPMERKY